MHNGSQSRPVLLFACQGVAPDPWVTAFARESPGLEVRVWPEAGDPAEVTYGFAWNTPDGFWTGFPQLRAILCLGAGVDRLLADPQLPAAASIVRMTDPSLARDMADFVLMRTLHHHRGLHAYEADRASRAWRPISPPPAARRIVGVLGLGALGRRCARDLARRGFTVRGWSRTARSVAGVATFHGQDGLNAFAEGCEILICLLPLTPQTAGILDGDLFARLAEGACLINVGRGAHLVDADLLAALESGRLAAATLDVFHQEPLPPDHPFWIDPRIGVFPHVAAFTDPDTAARVAARNIQRHLEGRPMTGVVRRSRGY